MFSFYINETNDIYIWITMLNMRSEEMMAPGKNLFPFAFVSANGRPSCYWVSIKRYNLVIHQSAY